MDKNKLVLPITILLASIILGGFYYVSETNKQQFIEKQRKRIEEVKRECFSNASEAKETAIKADNNAVISGLAVAKRADYDKIFNDEYNNCLREKGIE